MLDTAEAALAHARMVAEALGCYFHVLLVRRQVPATEGEQRFPGAPKAGVIELGLRVGTADELLASVRRFREVDGVDMLYACGADTASLLMAWSMKRTFNCPLIIGDPPPAGRLIDDATTTLSNGTLDFGAPPSLSGDRWSRLAGALAEGADLSFDSGFIARAQGGSGVGPDTVDAEKLGSKLAERLVPAFLRGLANPAGVPQRIASLLDHLGVDEPRPPAAQRDGLDLVFLWKQQDAGLYGRRVDMLAKYAARRPDVRSVTVFDAPVALEQVLDWEAAEPTSQHPVVAGEVWRKKWQLKDGPISEPCYRSFVYADPGVSPRTRLPSRGEFPEFIRSDLQSRGIPIETAVFVAYPVNEFLDQAIRELDPSRLIVDVVDDQRAWPDLTGPKKSAMDQSYRNLMQRADVVITNCRPVADSMSGYAERIHVVPNAAEPRAEARSPRKVPALESIDSPIIGYVGNLEPDKFDTELFRSLALARPGYHFVVVGSTHMNPALTGELSPLENVSLMGVVPYDGLGDYLQYFDCAVMPHKDTDQTRFMNPLKPYVFAAAGIPVVSTEVANLADLPPGLLTTAADESEFLSLVDRAVAEREALRPHDLPEDLLWPARVERIVTLLQAKTRSLAPNE